jgi:two-component system response regulator NreC
VRVLSKREREVLDLLARGHSNREVADRLRVGVKTIETYRARLRAKLGVKTRAELVRYATSHEIL